MKSIKNLIMLIMLIMGVFSLRSMNVFATEAIIGDTNNDGIISVSDATEILTYYAKTAAGQDVPAVNNKIYDVNHDGVIDITDATWVLTYYAETAAGQSDIKWPPAPVKYMEGDNVKYTGDVSWNLRFAPDVTTPVVLQIETGDTFSITSCCNNNDWYEIDYGGIYLYVQLVSHEFFEIV